MNNKERLNEWTRRGGGDDTGSSAVSRIFKVGKNGRWKKGGGLSWDETLIDWQG